MKAKEVMDKLNITRPTLCSYVKKGFVKVTLLPNGQYEYDDESVNNFKNIAITQNILKSSVLPVPTVTTQEMLDSISSTKDEAITECIKNSLTIFKYLQAMRVLPNEAIPCVNKLESAYKDLKNSR